MRARHRRVIMFIAAVGLVVRSAIGPVERLLNMLGHQHICALAYALAFVMNVAPPRVPTRRRSDPI